MMPHTKCLCRFCGQHVSEPFNLIPHELHCAGKINQDLRTHLAEVEAQLRDPEMVLVWRDDLITVLCDEPSSRKHKNWLLKFAAANDRLKAVLEAKP